MQNEIERLNEKIGKLAQALERSRIDEYATMLSHPWRFYLYNFAGGIFRGLGIAIGMTIVTALALFILIKILVRIVDLPIIGAYIAEMVEFVNLYIKQGVPVN